jgi:ribosome biogenesis GTPase
LTGTGLETGAVREADSKGRHTTTSRHLYRLDGGALLMDAPGFRTVGLWADEDALEDGFADIVALAKECRFDDCQHSGEPGCAVLSALERGELDGERWKSWQKQLREVRHLERQGDVHAQRKERDRWRAIHQSMRGFSKETRAGG